MPAAVRRLSVPVPIIRSRAWKAARRLWAVHLAVLFVPGASYALWLVGDVMVGSFIVSLSAYAALLVAACRDLTHQRQRPNSVGTLAISSVASGACINQLAWLALALRPGQGTAIALYGSMLVLTGMTVIALCAAIAALFIDRDRRRAALAFALIALNLFAGYATLAMLGSHC